MQPMDTNQDAADVELAARRNFSVRLPEPLSAQLQALSEHRGVSMNSLIGEAVATLVARPDYAPSGVVGDIGPKIAKDAVRIGSEAIGPLKGIAKHVSNRGQTALACVLWAAAARLVAASSGEGAASVEFAHSAAVAEKDNHFELALALYGEALRLDPNNLEAVNRLGQRLHHLAQLENDNVDRYREAERHLARVTFLDNHAKLFHGWSAFHAARADKDAYREGQALGEIEEALKGWAFGQTNGQARLSWLRQVRRLHSAGLPDRANSLLVFANRNARWAPVSEGDLR